MAISQDRRRYGDSLDKFEPNDLNAALCPSMEWLTQLLPRAEIAMEMAHVEGCGKLSAIGEAMFAELTETSASNAPAKEFVMPRNVRGGYGVRCAI